MNRIRRLFASVLAAAVLVAAASSARAADPYEINVILSLSGPVSFVGSTQMQALKALETHVNRTGGIGGRPVSFVFADDQSSPQTAVQLARGLIAKGIPILMGPSGPASCSAIAARSVSSTEITASSSPWISVTGVALCVVTGDASRPENATTTAAPCGFVAT